MARLCSVYAPKEVTEEIARAALWPELDVLQPAILCHGGEKAIDRAAADWCASTMTTMHIASVRSLVHRHGPLCGAVWAENVAQWSSTVVALWDPHTRAGASLPRAALRMGKHVVLVVLGSDGEVVDRLDTAGRGSPSALLEVLDRPRVPRPRKKRAA